MQRIIVTADDYGMCSEVDKAIDDGVANGFITSTNVLVNLETLSAAGDLRERFPRLSVGVHWNVTIGRPIRDPKDCPTLVDENGVFWPVGEFRRRCSKRLIAPDDLERELEAQLALFEKTCGPCDYWNSHENAALNTQAFKTFAKVARRRGVLATRTFQRAYFDKVGLGFKREFREFLARNFLEIWFSLVRRSFKMPTAQVVSFDKISQTEGDVLLNALTKDGRDLIEAVFHPATTAESPYFGNISDERVKEWRFVASRENFEKFSARGLKFVGFEALK